MAKKEYVITYVEKVYYKPVVVEAETVEEALDTFSVRASARLGCYSCSKSQVGNRRGIAFLFQV